MENLIFQYYEEYKQFMNIVHKNLPKLNPILINNSSQNDTLAYVMEDEIKYPITNLYYNEKLSCYSEQFVKAKMFHEFQHILDYILFYTEYSGKDLTAIMATYSEYNASKIELLKNIGLDSFHSLRENVGKYDLEKLDVCYENEFHNIEMDYIQHMADAFVIIDKPFDAYYELSAIEYYKKFKMFSTKTMYYLGKRKMCSFLSNKPIPNLTEKKFKEFSPFILGLEHNIEKRNFKLLYSGYNLLWKQFRLNFINKNRNILPKDI